MKPRIPLAYAGLLIVALVAVVGFAAFSPTSDVAVPETTIATDDAPPASARVASAILALRVSNPDTRTATTTTADEPETITTIEEVLASTQAASDAASTSDSTSTSDITTTEAPTTTAAPSTTETTATTQAPATTARDTTPPSLRVTSPDDGDTVSESVITFEGTTEPGARVTSGPFEADVDDDGSWSIALVLSPGANGASFTATDDAGNTTSLRIVVTYEPPQTTTTAAPPPPEETTTTTGASTPKWSPLWPADAGGIRNVEAWRPLVEKYWPANLVDCALNIIDLESKGDPRAYNSRTSAEGLFQHLSKYWKGRAAGAGFKDANGLVATPYNAEANIAAAWLIASGSDPWHRPWTVNPYYGACQP